MASGINTLLSIFISGLFLILIVNISVMSAFAGGDGSAGNPFQITTCAELQDMKNGLSANYVLVNDIDCNVAPFHAGAGFESVGTSSTPFTGTLDGQNYAITGLFINRPSTDYVGLFGYTGSDANITDVGLEDVDITGYRSVGGLVGRDYQGTITNSYATGSVAGSYYVGGLVGYASGATITNSYSTGNVSGYYVGGLVGYVSGATITNSYATGSVSGSNSVGGLVGYVSGATITNSYATGSVSGSGRLVGGLVGSASGATITNSYATGSVSGNRDVGGLVGYNSNNGAITNSYSTGNVSGSNQYAGGLVGRNQYATITNSYATGSVAGYQYVGGLVGFNSQYATITNSYATGSVAGSYSVGGLVGLNHYFGIITDSSVESGGPSAFYAITHAVYTGSPVWDFVNIWGIDEGVDYPFLQWETPSIVDSDGDSIADDIDNCPTIPNPLQTDTDNDTLGDACDPDDDNDGIEDVIDTSPLVFSSDFNDGDGTFGTITDRGGFTVTIIDLAGPAGVEVGIIGAGTTTRIVSCSNNVETQLNADGEIVDITCGSTTITAVVASPNIRVRDPESGTKGKAVRVKLTTGQSVTLGSPITADPSNTEPITVEIVDENDNVVGSGTLDAGQTIDIEPEGEGGQIVISNPGETTVSFTIDGETINLNPGQSYTEACVGVPGRIEYQGCPVADLTFVTLHIVDQGKPRTACPDGKTSCTSLLNDVPVKVFDRNDSSFKSAYTSRPRAEEYGDVFESSIGLVASCTTSQVGSCYAGEEQTGDYLVIAKYRDTDAGNLVYAGLPKDPSDFVDTDEDGIADLAIKDLQIMKQVKKDGSTVYPGKGRLTTVPFSSLFNGASEGIIVLGFAAAFAIGALIGKKLAAGSNQAARRNKRKRKA